MKGIALLLLGWVLGLIGPLIVDTFKSSRHKREIAAALRVELEDLQYRLAAASYLLISHYGNLDKTFLTWFQPIVERQDPNGATLTLIKQWMVLDDSTLSQVTAQLRSKKGIGSSLKVYQARFLESQLIEIAKMPVSVQRKIHEFRNQLDLLNQEIPKADSYMSMTFDSSLNERNRQIVNEQMNVKYLIVQAGSKVTADKIAAILLDI
jgi:hypothetical protein